MTVDVTKAAVWWRSVTRRPQPPPPPDSTAVAVGSTEQGEPVTWPHFSREHGSHALVMGSTGSGKTVMVAAALVAEIARADNDASYLIVDPSKGDLITHIVEGLATVCPERIADTFYLNPFSATAFPFNLCHLPFGETPLDLRALQLAALVSVVSTDLGEVKHLSTGSRQLDVTMHYVLGALATVEHHPAACVNWACDALVLPRGAEMLASITTSERARQFLTAGRLSDELRSSCAARLRLAFDSSDSVARVVSVPGQCVRFDELLGPRKICLVDLGHPPGGITTLSRFWANLFVRLAADYLMERTSPWPGHHTRICIDEAQVIAETLSDRAEAVLVGGRSRSISMVLLTQGTVLLHDASPTLLRVLLGNVTTKFLGRLSAADAELYARERAPRLGVEETIASVRQRFVTSVTNLPDRHFYRVRPGEHRRFVSRDVDLPAWEEAAANQAALVQAMKNWLALPPATGPRVTLADVAKLPERGRRPRGSGKEAPAPLANPQSPNNTTPPPPRRRSRWG